MVNLENFIDNGSFCDSNDIRKCNNESLKRALRKYNNCYSYSKYERLSVEYKKQMDQQRHQWDNYFFNQGFLNHMNSDLVNLKGISTIQHNRVMISLENLLLEDCQSVRKYHTRATTEQILLALYKIICENHQYHIKGFYRTSICRKYKMNKKIVNIVRMNLEEYPF